MEAFVFTSVALGAYQFSLWENDRVVFAFVAALVGCLAQETYPPLGLNGYLFYLTYSDIQARKREMPREGATQRIEYQLLRQNTVYMARNEHEGFQIFYREQTSNRSIVLKVSQFVNDNGNVLEHKLYKEAFLSGDAYPSEPFADPLVPFESGSSFDVVLNENEMFYVDLRSTKTQSSSGGLYNGTVGLYHSNGTLMEEKVVSVKVWDFDLPDTHYSDVVMGLYNSVSGYGNINSCLTLNGVKYATENGTWDVATESLPLAKEILARHQEVLLDHGINTYELPRWLIMDDPHAAMLAAMDPRRKLFVVPITRFDMA